MQFCSLPKNMEGRDSRGNLSQWPRGMTITWWVERAPMGVTLPEARKIYEEAFGLWEAVCGVKTEYAASRRHANLLITTQRIDGPAGVLAQAQLPNPGTTRDVQLKVWFDGSERWTTLKENWEGSGRFPLLAVAAHEFGHSLGLGHNTDGHTNALMDPAVSHIWKPQEWDIAEMIDRYGRPAAPKAENADLDKVDSQHLEDLLLKWQAKQSEADKVLAEILRIK